MNLSLSQPDNQFPDVGVSQILCEVETPMHHTLLCYFNIFVRRFSTVSRFRFRVPRQPTGNLPVTFWVDHLILKVQPVPLAGTSGPAQDELGLDAHPSGVCFPISPLGAVAPAMNCSDLGVIRRPMFSMEAAKGVPSCFGRWT